jgi:superfamily II DNA or RNA helicase
MHDALNDLAEVLQRFLGDALPACDPQWWGTCVLARLTFQQQRVIEERGMSSLSQLDLAALLRVFDQNWHELNIDRRLPHDVRNWLKEAQTIRNRWAHMPPGGLAPQDRYRDLDTICRLMTALDADEAAITRVSETRDEVFSTLGQDAITAPRSQPASPSGSITRGDVVRLKARPDHTGAVIDMLEGGGETRYLVFHDGTISTYYASQIELAAPSSAKRSVDHSALHGALTALQLRHPSTSHLYSLFASRIQFVPYQFRPVLKLIQSDRPRMLIADEVGVGKTIEAGLILKELQARRDIRSILVICPKPLVAERKWLEEMKRFDEQFVHLDGDALRYCIEETHLDGVWPQQYARAILPYSLCDEALLMGKRKGPRHQRGLLDLDPPPAFDLIVVDEAHHIRNTDTWAYRTVRHLCDNAEAVVLLSATPIQLGDNDLFNLLHLLRPDVLSSREDFDRMAEPNPHINAAIEAARAARPDWRDDVRTELQYAVATPWGKGVLAADPRLQAAYDLLTADEDDAEARITLVQKLEELYTFFPLINRTRRRDIGSFTTRKPDTVAVEFTPEQAALHGELIGLIARILAHRHGDQNLTFMLTTVRRQVSSCVFGLAPLLEAMLHRHLSRLELSEVGDESAAEEIGDVLAEFREEVDALIRKARALTGPDPKLDAFLKVIRDKQKLSNNKLLVFSTFRHTLAYLVEQLDNEPVRIGLVHGDIPEDERRDLRNRFSLPKEDPRSLDLLLSSEVGCEGLDYQFCDGLVNYDLPWNPMRVEQRIGRIDRYGQKSETVVIYNFITPGTVDAEIYERCLLRIGVFRQALGGSEEILGRLTREIRDIAENIALTPEEQSARLQQLADNEIRAIQEQARLEEEQAKLFGLNLPQRDQDMVKQASSFWLAPPMLANLVTRYLECLDAIKPQQSLGRKPIATLQLGQESRNKLLADFQTLGLSGTVARAWESWLKGSDPHITLTFDPSAAGERRDIVFITPAHPLARQAAQTIEPTTPLVCNLWIESGDLLPGRYPYAIYRWRKLGLKEDFTFQPVCAHPKAIPQMLQLLEYAKHHEVTSPISTVEEQELEQAHYLLWTNARAGHIQEVTEVARSRMTSLETSHAARLAQLEEQRDTATDARIRRMRESQIETAMRDYERRTDDLNRAAQQGDIIAEAVAFGVLVVGESNGRES